MQPIDMKQVVAAVDFSDWTKPVLDMAARMAEAYGAGVTAVYAERFMPPPYFTEGALPQVLEALETQRKAAARALEETVRRQIGGRVKVETRLVEKTPTEGILETAAEADAGLIVLGTHGRSGLNRLLLGSVAENVLRQSRIPVLTVRGAGEVPQTPAPVRRILCPVNFSEIAMASVQHAADLAGRLGAELTVMRIEEGGTEDEAAVRDRICAWMPEAAQARCEFRPEVRRGEAARSILQAVEEDGFDLVVIGAQHRPLLETTVLGTTSIRVVRHATCPVYTVVGR